MIVNIDAVLVQRSKSIEPDGSIIETVIWELPEPVPGSKHAFKYRLYYGRDGNRIVGFNNERGKGDHLHRRNIKVPYAFNSVETLIEDFFAEIERSEEQ